MNPTTQAKRSTKVEYGAEQETNRNVIFISTPEQIQNYIDAAVEKAFEKAFENITGFSNLFVKPEQEEESPITSKELCRILDISAPTLLRSRKKGKIPFMRLGGRILYSKSSVLAALQQNPKK